MQLPEYPRGPQSQYVRSPLRAGGKPSARPKSRWPPPGVVLPEDGAIGTLVLGDAVPGDLGLVRDFFPAKLVGVPLRQGRSQVRVFVHRQLERKSFRIGEEVFWRENRDDDRHKVDSTGHHHDHKGGLQPLQAPRLAFGSAQTRMIQTRMKSSQCSSATAPAATTSGKSEPDSNSSHEVETRWCR